MPGNPKSVRFYGDPPGGPATRGESAWNLVRTSIGEPEFSWDLSGVTPFPTQPGVLFCESRSRAPRPQHWEKVKWSEAFSEALFEHTKYIHEMVELRWQTTLLDKTLIDLRKRVERLEAVRTVLVPIQSLDPEPFELTKPILALVEPSDDEFIASFSDANIAATGETQGDAIANLKDMLVATFELLESEKKLGAEMRRKQSVLAAFVRQAG